MTNFPHMVDITIILCSPLRRTMQTALLTFQPLYARELKLILWPALREWGNGASNIGYPVAEMEREMASLPVDLRLLNEGWELETDSEDEGPERSNRVRKDLYELGEALLMGGTWKDIPMEKHAGPVHIMVVSHGGFLANIMWADGKLSSNLLFKDC
jgi:broad specificity phosphatase PhoE